MTVPTNLRGPTRRQVLAGTLLFALAACADGNAVESGFSPADDALRRQTAADEQHLLAAYAATAARHPDLAGRLAVPWQQHREHAARLATTGSSAATNPAASKAAPPAPAVPASAGAAVRALANLERSVAAARREACATAGRGLAPMLGTLAAAELVHADVLLDGGVDGGRDKGRA